MMYHPSQKLLIAGTCAVESEEICLQVADTLKACLLYTSFNLHLFVCNGHP